MQATMFLGKLNYKMVWNNTFILLNKYPSLLPSTQPIKSIEPQCKFHKEKQRFYTRLFSRWKKTLWQFITELPNCPGV